MKAKVVSTKPVAAKVVVKAKVVAKKPVTARFKVVALPHLGLKLKIGSVYAAPELIGKCGCDGEKEGRLMAKLRDEAFFARV